MVRDSDALFRTVPALGELAVGVMYGHLQSRPGLDSRLREAATLAAVMEASVSTHLPILVYKGTAWISNDRASGLCG